MTADVYFANMRAAMGQSLPDKLRHLWQKAGLAGAIAPDDLVAVKLHFGERGNLAYIHPVLVRTAVEQVKAGQGRPFLTDTNTLYVGSRSNAVDHLETALMNGFAYTVAGAPLVIADGLKGRDYRSVPVDGRWFKEAKIGSAIALADALVVLSHFKGHELTGFGGALKNLGMGCGTPAGKQMMHADMLPAISAEECIACGQCSQWCPGQAIAVADKASIAPEKCLGCGECVVACRQGAIQPSFRSKPEVLQEKIVEYASGALQGKRGKAVFLNFVMNVSPECDCNSFNDAALVGDLGILASLDPVAIDQASFDLVQQAPPLPGTKLDGQPDLADKFRAATGYDGTHQLAYAEELGLGSRAYRLVAI